jgi:hypothetical protein
MVVDDNSTTYSHPTIQVIQIPEQQSESNKFTKSSTVTMRKQTISWDKALFYFSSINTQYKHVWFIEDDVFFHNEQTLINIDKKYSDSDLLCSPDSENKLGLQNVWHWGAIDIRTPPPYYCAMICAVRMSHTMLQKIKEYTQLYHSLFFIEAMFPTICKQNNLRYDSPPELSTVRYVKDYTIENITSANLYHPAKDIAEHILFRQIIEDKTRV